MEKSASALFFCLYPDFSPMRTRVIAALSAGLKHFLVSMLVAAVAAGVVFGLWYPNAYADMAGGRLLFLLLVAVDVVCGPLLTMIVYSPMKPKAELVRDIGFIALLQLAALAYGLYSVAQARPVYLGYESGRFRLVSAADIDPEALKNALPELRELSWTGPKLIGVRLLGPEDPGYASSIVDAMAGLPPAFRPERWMPYEHVIARLRDDIKPLEMLKNKYPDAAERIDIVVTRSGINEKQAGFLPVNAERAASDDWVAIVARGTGAVIGFLPLDGW